MSSLAGYFRGGLFCNSEAFGSNAWYTIFWLFIYFLNHEVQSEKTKGNRKMIGACGIEIQPCSDIHLKILFSFKNMSNIKI